MLRSIRLSLSLTGAAALALASTPIQPSLLKRMAMQQI
ncbi:Hypothetical protein P9303_05821 [Prochlorococcus marinus str. MIT 9303]|uniref:Uncharacterized protein n=1 Tax=Prochlorococcus marinus (strain MIT 9303) TaxID=59922 RepID=A2C774_PROM3|nr:Hypothetical protein P9303_05821 [Prochlorococcus marinus str. MIT 9303]